MVMHAIWMVNDKSEQDKCICQKKRVASSGHLVETYGKPLCRSPPTDVREWPRHYDESEWSLMISLKCPLFLP